MNKIEAVLFDLHGTVAYREDCVTAVEVAECLFSRGYEVSSQQLKAAWAFVAFIDYPRYGYRNWRSYFSRILWRLRVKADEETLKTIIRMLESDPYRLYPDAADAVKTAKLNGFKTAIGTTIAYLQFRNAIQPIRKYFDFIMTGYEAGCDKSNPKMYKKILEVLEIDPHDAVMIGDDMQLDILLPKRLGMNTILLNREGKNKCETVDAFVYDLNEAMKTIIRERGRN